MVAELRNLIVDSVVAGQRLDKALAQLLPDLSRSTVSRWVREGRVTHNGALCRPRDLVALGDELQIVQGHALPTAAEADPSVEFRVVHDDAALVVVEKPAGLVVHPARGHWDKTLVNGLLALPGFHRAVDPKDPSGALRPGVVHRLDKDTSGLLVVAKTDTAREALKSQLAQHSMQREYVAITLGIPAAGTLKTLHARDPRSRLRFSSKVNRGKEAITHLHIEEELQGAALVRCRLETGRTHQIRVHLALERKTPVFGDALYGRPPHEPRVGRLWAGLGRHALHAAVLGFVHPTTRKVMCFSSPLPPELCALKRELTPGTTT